MSIYLKVLHIEDDESDALLLTRFLEKNGFDIEYTRIDTKVQVEKVLAQKEWDLIISDFMLPGMNGLDVFKIVKESGVDIPFIIVSGQIGEETAVEAMRAGVKDFINKDNMARLIPAIKREMKEYENRKRHKKIESLLKKTKDEFERHRRQEQEMKLLGQLVSGVAHEVRNPLNAITALLEALFQDDIADPENISMYKKYINAQVDRLNHLMKDLLELGNPNNSSEFIELDLVALCGSTVEFWNNSLTADSKAVSFKNETGKEDLKILGDYTRLQQVLVNLFQNASHHSPQNSLIQLVLSVWEGKINIRVVDKGSGISEEMVDRVFEPFFTTRKSGTGLGLGIARSILAAHSGTIKLENNKAGEGGCTATITIPDPEQKNLSEVASGCICNG
ncbi:histidine kinase [Chitinispirillum alkaliphilum]|nr:histidine kinase [Chitinispirillum alkaliphilum]